VPPIELDPDEKTQSLRSEVEYDDRAFAIPNHPKNAL